MDRFVLDTSVFTNPDVFSGFGEDTQAAIRAFLTLARRSRAEYYMPGSVYEELRLVKDLTDLTADFEVTVQIRSPRKFALQVPANLLYEFIDEARARIDHGLRIAEEHARLGHRTGEQQDLGPVITKLRERYREALRRGIIDSREDADVLLLAYELDAALVSADEGLRRWAEKVGVRVVGAGNLKAVMERLGDDTGGD